MKRLPVPLHPERLCDEELAELILAIGPTQWKVGLSGSVVRDRLADDVEEQAYYGGPVVCETVSGKTAKLIAATPDLALEVYEARMERKKAKERVSQWLWWCVLFAIALTWLHAMADLVLHPGIEHAGFAMLWLLSLFWIGRKCR